MTGNCSLGAPQFLFFTKHYYGNAIEEVEMSGTLER
jgi:hypothetical protein